MAVDTLRCRICESDYPAVASGVCLRCFGPLEPVYDWDQVASEVTRESIEARPALALALRAPLADRGAAGRGRRAGLDAARARSSNRSGGRSA